MIESNLIAGMQTLGASSLPPLGGAGTGVVGAVAETVKAAGVPGDLGAQTGDGFRERFEASAGLAGSGLVTTEGTFSAESGGVRTPLLWQAPEVEEAMISTLPTASSAAGVDGDPKESMPAGTVLDSGVAIAGTNLGGSAGFVGVGSVEEDPAGETAMGRTTGVKPAVEVEAAPVEDGSLGESAKAIDTRAGTDDSKIPLTIERAATFEGVGAIRPDAVPVSTVKGGVVTASFTPTGISSRVPAAGSYVAAKTPSLEPVEKLGNVGSAGAAASEAAGTSQKATSKRSVGTASQPGAEKVTASKAPEDLPGALHPAAVGSSAVAAAVPAPIEVADAATAEGDGKDGSAISAVQGKSEMPSAQASKKKHDAASAAAPAGMASQVVGIMAGTPIQAIVPGGVAVAVLPDLHADGSDVEVNPPAHPVEKSNAVTSGVRTNAFEPPVTFQARISFAAIRAMPDSSAASGAAATSSGKPASADTEPRIVRTQGGGGAAVNDAVPSKTSVDVGHAGDVLAGAGKRVTALAALAASAATNEADGVGTEAIAKDDGAKRVTTAADFANSIEAVQPAATGAVQSPSDTKQVNEAVKAGTTSRLPTTYGVAPSAPLTSGAASAASAVQTAGERVSTAGAARVASEPASAKPGVLQTGLEVMQHSAVAGVTPQVQLSGFDGAKVSIAGLGASSRAAEVAAAASGGLEHMTLVSTPNVLEVGVASGTNGWLKIRAEMDGTGGVAASVVTTTAGAAEALHKELPALSAYLRDESVGVSSLVVNRSEAGAMAQDATANLGAGGFGAGSQGGHGGQTNSGNAPMVPDIEAVGVEPVRGSMRGDLAGVNALVTGYGAGSGGWVNVVA